MAVQNSSGAVQNSSRTSEWRPQARILLQPIAAPAVLGYFALASALIIYGSWFTGAWGTLKDTISFAPFLFFFGGIGQFGAAMWAYKARDAVAAAFNGSWAAFWLGTSVMYLLVATGAVTVPPLGAHFGPLGMWFMYMAAVSWTTAFAALARSPGGFCAQAVLGTASAIAAVGLLHASAGWESVAGWMFVAAAAFSFYIGFATMLDNVYGIVALPLATWRRRENTFGRSIGDPIQYSDNDPGVKVGQ